MAYCEQIWYQDSRRQTQVTEEDRGHCHEILSQVSPSLIRILQAIKFITYAQILIHKTHILLDFSWDELRVAFRSLRLLIGHEGDGLIRIMPKVAFDMAFSREALLSDLTCGCLRVMRRILSGEVDKAFQ
jgi:hypothetical protein